MCTITKEVAVSVLRDDQNRPVIAITTENSGHVMVTLNDGVLWDQDPEVDAPELLDGFVPLGGRDIECIACGEVIDTKTCTVRAQVAAAKLHECEARQ